MTCIYEVNLAVDPEIEQAFSRWLPGHVARVLALPGFIDAVIEAEQRQVGQPASYCVRYRLENAEALKQYLKTHAATMRQEGIDQFGDRFRASRRILDVLERLNK